MGSVRKQKANRRNAQKSTGPRTPAGQARASRNALKHGLAAASRLRDLDGIVAELAQDVLADLQMDQVVAPAFLTIIEAELDLLQARQIRIMLLQCLQGAIKNNTLSDVTTLLNQLSRADRYERRALSRRKFAVRDIMRGLRDLGSKSASDLHKLPPNREGL